MPLIPSFYWFVNVPVADLRREPLPYKKGLGKDILQESQLLFGERVLITGEKEGWVLVSCPEQQRYSAKEGWQGYPGWIEKIQLVSHASLRVNNCVVIKPYAPLYHTPSEAEAPILKLSLGTHLEEVLHKGNWAAIQLPSKEIGYIRKDQIKSLAAPNEATEIRQSLLSIGRKLLDSPYAWGGRSAYDISSKRFTGVDCSGLANLIYRVHGKLIPRDAHDQFLKSRPCESKDLEMGDLVFTSAPKEGSRISHVMIAAGGDLLLESAMQPNCVREITCSERFGRPLKELKQGELVKDSRIWFGKIL